MQAACDTFNHTWKATNVVMYCDTRTDVHIHTQTHTQKKMYIYNNSHINYGSDKKYKEFYNNKFGSYTVTPIGITLNLL